MITIKDVARVAGVSPSTVSRVVRGEGKVGKVCRAKVQKVIDELGYRPNINAQALVNQKSNTLGVIMPNVSMSFFGALACGAEQAAKEQNYRVVISNAFGSEKAEMEAIDSLMQHRCDAIVMHSAHASDEVLCKLADKIPGLVFINRFIPQIPNRCVWLDNNLGAQEAARYILSKGHIDIAVITREVMNSDAKLRFEGIKTALNSAGVSLNETNVGRRDADMAGGRAAVRELISNGVKFSAVLVYNDNMAIGVIHELHACGIQVPQDVSVIGFDDLLISVACLPQLTTMHYPVEEMASYAAKLAIELSENSISSGRTHLFMPHLVERGSVIEATAIETEIG
ncbi:LacI family DNA-binding transcriptional regulator [Thalassotalea fonticola]|uniref:LacI family DNA-binding transcriptional regulator n=1 Tax=Thalassotalea fonticola TaxID=3065649 RepID=A0ABZ0GJG6_9GAMM|nr:LacI family DNA-binding transcriptional regulator [Colwelliaceae bacterium S1-1]